MSCLIILDTTRIKIAMRKSRNHNSGLEGLMHATVHTGWSVPRLIAMHAFIVLPVASCFYHFFDLLYARVAFYSIFI